jgi:hypothetical protein
VIRRLDSGQPAPRTGIFRIAWDLRYRSPAVSRGRDADEVEESPSGPRGPFVLPGKYEVRLRAGGEEQRQTVEVLADPLVSMSADDRQTWHDTLVALSDMYRVSRAALTTLDQLQKDGGDAREEIAALVTMLRGEPAHGVALTPEPPALAQQISQLLTRIEASTALPTADQQRLTRRSHERLTELISRLRKVAPDAASALVLAPLPARVR